MAKQKANLSEHHWCYRIFHIVLSIGNTYFTLELKDFSNIRIPHAQDNVHIQQQTSVPGKQASEVILFKVERLQNGVSF